MEDEPHWWIDAAALLDAWVAKNDPDGEMTLLEQIDAYAAENDAAY